MATLPHLIFYGAMMRPDPAFRKQTRIHPRPAQVRHLSPKARDTVNALVIRRAAVRAGPFIHEGARVEEALTLLRGRSRSELAGADLVIAPSMGESGWMRPVKIPSFFKAGLEALDEALPEVRRLLAGAAAAKAKSA